MLELPVIDRSLTAAIEVVQVGRGAGSSPVCLKGNELGMTRPAVHDLLSGREYHSGNIQRMWLPGIDPAFDILEVVSRHDRCHFNREAEHLWRRTMVTDGEIGRVRVLQVTEIAGRPGGDGIAQPSIVRKPLSKWLRESPTLVVDADQLYAVIPETDPDLMLRRQILKLLDERHPADWPPFLVPVLGRRNAPNPHAALALSRLGAAFIYSWEPAEAPGWVCLLPEYIQPLTQRLARIFADRLGLPWIVAPVCRDWYRNRPEHIPCASILPEALYAADGSETGIAARINAEAKAGGPKRLRDPEISLICDLDRVGSLPNAITADFRQSGDLLGLLAKIGNSLKPDVAGFVIPPITELGGDRRSVATYRRMAELRVVLFNQTRLRRGDEYLRILAYAASTAPRDAVGIIPYRSSFENLLAASLGRRRRVRVLPDPGIFRLDESRLDAEHLGHHEAHAPHVGTGFALSGEMLTAITHALLSGP